jgi:signal peptidase I
MSRARSIAALALAALMVAALIGPASPQAASPDDAAGVPFLTFAHALGAGDDALACAQFSDQLLRKAGSPIATLEQLRSACPKQLASEVNDSDRAQFASTRVVGVTVKPGRARVTVQTTFHDLAPLQTGTAIVENGAWKILDTASGAHVGTSYLTQIPSESMQPTLHVGDTVLVDHAAYRHAKPAVGDIVVFHPPANAENIDHECGKRPPKGQACAVAGRGSSKVNFIKRIVAGPGDRIAIRKGHVIRNGRLAKEPFITPCRGGVSLGCDFPRPFTVPKGRYYLMGDNRAASDDSRFWGPVAASAIVGRAGPIIPRDPDPAPAA